MHPWICYETKQRVIRWSEKISDSCRTSDVLWNTGCFWHI